MKKRLVENSSVHSFPLPVVWLRLWDVSYCTLQTSIANYSCCTLRTGTCQVCGNGDALCDRSWKLTAGVTTRRDIVIILIGSQRKHRHISCDYCRNLSAFGHDVLVELAYWIGTAVHEINSK